MVQLVNSVSLVFKVGDTVRWKNSSGMHQIGEITQIDITPTMGVCLFVWDRVTGEEMQLPIPKVLKKMKGGRDGKR